MCINEYNTQKQLTTLSSASFFLANNCDLRSPGHCTSCSHTYHLSLTSPYPTPHSLPNFSLSFPPSIIASCLPFLAVRGGGGVELGVPIAKRSATGEPQGKIYGHNKDADDNWAGIC